MTILQDAFDRLLAAYGPQSWWPGETQLEIMVGAVLTQNTAWRNVEKAIKQLREDSLLSLDALDEIDAEPLSEVIRPAGYYRLKAKRLKNLVRFICTEYDGDLEWMFSHSWSTLRQQLLCVNGIGPETADSILLYAGEKPTFVVDAYTARILKRHGWIEPEAGYYQMQELFQFDLPDDVAMFNEYHALIVKVGKEHCGTRPKCDGCPLSELLPECGPLDFADR